MDFELSDDSGVTSPESGRRSSTQSSDIISPPVPVIKTQPRRSAKVLAPITMRNGPPTRKRRSNETDDEQHDAIQNKRRYEKLRHVERVAEHLSSTPERMGAGTSSGIIKSLTLYNFMCHESFHQNWHENLNFVIGENGSGKSALLSGLLVGLGAKALSTSRTSSVKDLIKTGKSFAKIEVTLFNRGNLSEELYGDEFTIQRILDIKGTSTYKLQKDGVGKFRPLRKQELDKILMDSNIQLENPVVILNQEYARSFLCSKNPKDKYKLFQDGIGAVRCEQTLEEVQDDLHKIKESLSRKEVDKKSALAKYHELKEKVKMLQGVAQFKADLLTLGIELAWTHVDVDKKAVLKCKKDVEQCEANCVKTQKALDESIEKKRKFEEESAPSRNVQEEKRKEQSRLTQLMSSCRAVLSTLRSEIATTKRAITEKTRSIGTKNKYVSKLEEKAAEDQEKEKRDYEIQKQQNEEEQEELRAQIPLLEQEVKSLKQDGEQFFQGAESIRKEQDEIRNKSKEIEGLINRKKASLNRIKSSSATDIYGGYGRCMSILIDKIKVNEKRFKAPVRGPLGSRFKVTKPEYAKIIAFVLGPKLCDFVVDNANDASLLNKLIGEVYGIQRMKDNPRPAVHLNKFCKPHDFAANNASRGLKFPTIIDLLEIDDNDHIITNALLDICSVERILLFKNPQEALTIFTDKSTVPKSCVGGFTLDFYKVTPDPNLRIDVQYQKANQLDVIRTSNANQLRQLQVDIRALEEQMSQYKIDDDKVKEERRLRNESEKRLTAFRQKRTKLSSLQLKLKSLTEAALNPPDVTSRNEEILEVREEIEKLQNDVSALETKLKSKEPELEAKEKKKAEYETELEAIRAQLENYEEYKEQLKEKARKLDTFIDRFKANLEKQKAEKGKAEEKLGVAEQKACESTAKALESGEEVTVHRTVETIMKESQLIRVKIDEIEKNVGDRDRIYEQYEIAKKRSEKINRDFKMVKHVHEQLDKYALKVRNYYFSSRNRIVTALIDCFQSIVKSRNYKGQVVIDHDEKELYYFICPDKEASDKLDLFEKNSNAAQYKKQMKEYVAGLSGGERSFSTICFIISLWQSMKSPFYMLDEFDVFMDAINRKTSQTALMSHARAFPGNQFFFFTPLDLTAIPSKDEALVLRMNPPSRNSGSTGDENILPSQPTVSTTEENAPTSSRRRRTDSSNVPSRSAKTSRK